MRPWLRLTLIGVIALGQGTCAHPRIQQPSQPNHYLLEFAIPGSDYLCVQQRDGRWSCIHVDDLRTLLGTMAKA